jgi:hypothetical protein
MADQANLLTEADIFADIVAPHKAGMRSDLARSILSLRFSGRARKRMNQLAAKNRRGTISDQERAEMDKYVRVGLFLDLMHAKARTSLHAGEDEPG